MARSHLTLAALATSAVAGLDIVAASGFGSGAVGDYESALLTGRDGRHWIIRVPTSERAEAEQSADLVALRALSTGVRTRLPFTVSNFAGQTPISGTRAVVYEFVYGSKVTLASIPADEGLASSIGRAVAAIHTLPTSFVADAGLPVLTPVEILRSTVTIMDRASATGLVPSELLGRWERATEDAALWQFAPTVINGALGAESFLSAGGEVTGLLDWHSLSVGDPARDLYWLLGVRGENVAETAFDAYNLARGSSDRQVRQRAMLYAELEIAKWLLHGTQERSTEIVDDAVEMLSGLVDTVHNDLQQNLGHNTMPVLAIDEVEAMLDRNQRTY
ncbi:MAG TPA: phosphotransferase [Lacisediminihabitans sp.]|uniref:phosphotransferase n=1 Tax=Lacisediminihabitans sp. TaxID=2787631 RepID=UPI002EDA9721